MVKEFICEVYNNSECSYYIEFRNEDGEVLEFLEENCLDNCLIDLYDFERSCYDKYCETNFDIVKIRINDVEFGL